jgi:hypothetical protein
VATPTKQPIGIPPTAYPTNQLSCSEIPYSSCFFDDGYYVSTSCTLQVTNVYEAASTPEIEVLASTQTDGAWDLNSSSAAAGVFAGAAFVVVFLLVWSCVAKTQKKQINNTSYVKVSSKEEIPFATAPLKLGANHRSYGEYRAEL